MNTPARIIFFGTPAFAVTVLSKLQEAGITPIAVVTSPARPAGRGHLITDPALAVFARKHTVHVFQPESIKDSEFLAHVRRLQPDVCAIASYGHIVPKELLDIPPHGFINVHPSLLPKHRGPSPIQTAILDGDAETGVTLMLTDTKMDHGPVLAQQKLEKDISHATYTELHDALAELGGIMLAEILPAWTANILTPQPQDHTQATYTKLFTKEDGRIDWTKPVAHIDRMVRALNPWPGTWTIFGDPISDTTSEIGSPTQKRVKMLAGHVTKELINIPPGTVTKTKNGDLAVACGDGRLFVIQELQVAGGKTTNRLSVSGLFF